MEQGPSCRLLGPRGSCVIPGAGGPSQAFKPGERCNEFVLNRPSWCLEMGRPYGGVGSWGLNGDDLICGSHGGWEAR